MFKFLLICKCLTIKEERKKKKRKVWFSLILSIYLLNGISTLSGLFNSEV